MMALQVFAIFALVRLRGGAAQTTEELLTPEFTLDCPTGRQCVTVAHSYPATSTDDDANLVEEGTEMAMGYRYWADQINVAGFTRPGSVDPWFINLFQYNDRGVAENVTAIYTNLVDNMTVATDILAGPFSTALTRAAIEGIRSSTNPDRTLVYGHGPGADLWEMPTQISNQFSVMSTTDQFATTVLEDLGSDDYFASSISILRLESDDVSTQIADELLEVVNDPDSGFNLVSDGMYMESESTDLTTQFQALVDIDPNPDMFFAIGLPAHTQAFLDGADAVGFRPKAFVFPGEVADAVRVRAVGDDAAWVIGTTQWHFSLGLSDEFWGTAQEFSDGFAAWNTASDNPASENVASSVAVGATIVEALSNLDVAVPLNDMFVPAMLSNVDIDLFYGKIDLTGTDGGIVRQNSKKPMYMTQAFADDDVLEVAVVAPEPINPREVRYPAPGAEPEFEIVEPCPEGQTCIVIGFSWPADFDTQQHQEGSEMRLGYKYWARKLNEEGGFDFGGAGRSEFVELRGFNDHNVNEITREIYRQMCAGETNATTGIDYTVDYVFGPYGTSKVVQALLSVREANWTMIFGHGAGEEIFDDDYDRVFGVMTSAADYSTSAILQLQERFDASNAVSVYLSSAAFTSDVWGGVVFNLEAEGITHTANRSYQFSTQDQASITERVRELAEVDMYPDIFFGIGFTAHAALFVNAINETGIRPKAIFLTSAPPSPTWVADNLDIANLLIGPTQWHFSLPEADDFFGNASEFSESFQEFDPDPVDLHATHNNAAGSAVGFVFQTAYEAAASRTQEGLASELSTMEELDTFFGKVRFDIKGRNAAKDMITTQTFVDGDGFAIEVVAPFSDATRDLVYPIPGNEEPVMPVTDPSQPGGGTTTSDPSGTTSSSPESTPLNSAPSLRANTVSVSSVLVTLAVALTR